MTEHKLVDVMIQITAVSKAASLDPSSGAIDPLLGEYGGRASDRAHAPARRPPMKTVRQLLRTKGHEVLSVAPDTAVFEALRLMAEKNVGAMPCSKVKRWWVSSRSGTTRGRSSSRGSPPRRLSSARS